MQRPPLLPSLLKITAPALIGVTGVAQLAMANAERNKVKNMTLSGAPSADSAAATATPAKTGARVASGREQDGKYFPDADYDPDKRGYIDKPTVIVGEGPAGKSKEWVASNAAVENPTVAPILDLIDRQQQAGNICSFDLNAAMRARAAEGFAAGGSIDKPASPSSPQSPETANLVDTLVKALSKAEFTAPVVLSELEARKKRLDASRKFGSKR